jgi:hypothetical protein
MRRPRRRSAAGQRRGVEVQGLGQRLQAGQLAAVGRFDPDLGIALLVQLDHGDTARLQPRQVAAAHIHLVPVQRLAAEGAFFRAQRPGQGDARITRGQHHVEHGTAIGGGGLADDEVALGLLFPMQAAVGRQQRALGGLLGRGGGSGGKQQGGTNGSDSLHFAFPMKHRPLPARWMLCGSLKAVARLVASSLAPVARIPMRASRGPTVLHNRRHLQSMFQITQKSGPAGGRFCHGLPATA